MPPALLLASQSPRRRETLATLGISHQVLRVSVDETPLAGEGADGYVERVVRDKLAAASRARMALGPELRALPVLVADTTVTIDGAILGKPESAAAALSMLRTLRGRTHRVLTCQAIGGPAGSEPLSLRTIESRVTFIDASDELLERYVASGEPSDKAGAYAIQGVGSFLVRRLDGSYSAVVGLAAAELVEELFRLGITEVLRP